MSASIISKEKNVVSVEFSVSREDFEKAIDKAYLKVRNKVTIQGFRKGKAPKHLIERVYGKGIFYDEAVDIALYEEYPKMLDELKLNPIDRPEVDIKEMEDGKDVVFTAKIEVAPDFEIGNYKGVEFEKAEFPVTDVEIEDELKRKQDQNSRIIEVTDRPVKDGDTLLIDYSGYVENEQFEGGTAENQTLVIGSKKFIPGFEEQLIGKNIGEEVEINVTFPEEYHSEDLKGKDAIFKVKIHEIKEKELPELDDEFAKDISEFDTLDELKEDIKKNLEEAAIEKEKGENERRAIDALVNMINIEIPEKMVDKEIEYQAKNYEQQFRMQGMKGKDLDGFLENLVKEYKTNYRDQAEKNVKTDLIINKIIEIENISVEEEDINNEMKLLAKAYGISDDRLEDFKNNILGTSKSYIEENIQKRKAVELVVENAKIIKSKKAKKAKTTKEAEGENEE